MFMGPLEVAKPWNPRDVEGIYRFLHRCWRLIVGEDENARVRPNLGSGTGPGADAIERALNRCIQKVTDDLDHMAFNTAISAMMIFVNEATPKAEEMGRSQADRFVLILAPFAPHLAEELWERLGHPKTLAYEPWPTYDPALLQETTLEIPVQVNGKVRTKITVPVGIGDEDLKKAAQEAIAPRLEGKTIRRIIVVPKKLVNVVVG
jgi:leucyl-tRNA synthetase